MQQNPAIVVAANSSRVAVGDFNGDGKLDLAIVNQEDNTVSILLGKGDGTFGPATTYRVEQGPVAVAVGDFNGDGKDDLVVTHGVIAPIIDADVVFSGDVNTVSILLGYGDGSSTSSPPTPVRAAVGDFNKDGRLDLAIVNMQAATVSIALGQGDGTFLPAPGSPMAAGHLPYAILAADFTGNCKPYTILTADFNGDGKPDLAVTNEGDNTVSILLGQGDGTFVLAPQSPVAVGAEPLALAAADFNGAGKLDLAVANYGDKTVSILWGQGNGTFIPKPTPIQIGGSGAGPLMLAAVDFNGDGKPDLVVNWGSFGFRILPSPL